METRNTTEEDSDGIEKYAIWSFIAGLLSLVFGWWICLPFPFLGVILSSIALTRIKRDETRKGRGFAAAGLALSFISIGLMIVFAVIIVWLRILEKI